MDKNKRRIIIASVVAAIILLFYFVIIPAHQEGLKREIAEKTVHAAELEQTIDNLTYENDKWPTSVQSTLDIPEENRWYNAADKNGTHGTVVGPVHNVDVETSPYSGEYLSVHLTTRAPRDQITVFFDRTRFDSSSYSVLKESLISNSMDSETTLWLSVSGKIECTGEYPLTSTYMHLDDGSEIAWWSESTDPLRTKKLSDYKNELDDLNREIKRLKSRLGDPDYSPEIGSEYQRAEEPTGGQASNPMAITVSKSNIPSYAIAWDEAGRHVGETVTLCGPVVNSSFSSSSTGQPAFIDIGVAYPDTERLSLVVWGENRGNFNGAPESMYLDELICVTGEVYVRNGVCYVEVTTPSQIEIM